MRIWRISNHADLSGTGGLRAGGRWHHRGHPIVYCSENPATALLEILVHLEFASLDDIPTGYQLLEIDVPDTLSVVRLDPDALPANWRARQNHTQAIGDRWLATLQSAVLAVPSALVPHTVNYLLNPIHPDAAKLHIESIARHPFDERLFKPA